MEHGMLLSDLLISLLKDPSAVLELVSVFLLGFYMFQLVKEHSLSLEDSNCSGDDFFSSEGKRSPFGSIPARPIPLRVADSARAWQRDLSQRDYASLRRELPTREHFGFFHKTVFSDLSDRGAIFPNRSMSREEQRKLYGVGTYVSCHKRSLRKSSAKRMRLPN